MCPVVESLWSSPQYGTTPLIWAARKGHYDSVMHLLANGADVDQEGAVCCSPSCGLFSLYCSFRAYSLICIFGIYCLVRHPFPSIKTIGMH